jgi:hypothetical protein
MRLAQLVKFLRANDVQITLSGDCMAYDAPQGVITADIAADETPQGRPNRLLETEILFG